MFDHNSHRSAKQPVQWTILDKMIFHHLLSRDYDLTPAALRVGIELSNHFNTKSMRCDPSVSRLANLLRVSPRTIQSATSLLEDHGWIKISFCSGQAGANQYFLNFAIARLFHQKVQPKGEHAARSFLEMQCPPGRSWFPLTPEEMDGWD